LPKKDKKLKKIKKGKKETEESGADPGIISSTTSGEAQPKSGSSKVKAQGKGVVRPTTITTTTKPADD